MTPSEWLLQRYDDSRRPQQGSIHIRPIFEVFIIHSDDACATCTTLSAIPPDVLRTYREQTPADPMNGDACYMDHRSSNGKAVTV